MAAVHQLPPLILHPFTDGAASADLVQTAKEAADQLSGGPEPENHTEQLRLRVQAGRYAELKMLLFVGKDLFRWLEQCLDFAARNRDLQGRGYVAQSFAQFLIAQTPEEVVAKLQRWGVHDYARIFSRSIGIYAQFQEPPDAWILQGDYLTAYYRFADYAYACWRDSTPFPRLPAGEFTFALFASGEYSKFLERQWQG